MGNTFALCAVQMKEKTATDSVLLLLYCGVVQIAGWPLDLFDFAATVLPIKNWSSLESWA